MLVVSSEKRMTNWQLKPRIIPASFPNHPAATVACKLVSVRRVTAEDQTARFLHFVIQQSCTRYSSTLLWAIHRILITVQVQTRSATQQLTQNEKQLIGSHPPSPICLDSSLHHSGDACRPVWPLTLIKVTCMHLLPWKSNSLNCLDSHLYGLPWRDRQCQAELFFKYPTWKSVLFYNAYLPDWWRTVTHSSLFCFQGWPLILFWVLQLSPSPSQASCNVHILSVVTELWPCKDISQLCSDFW